jgi:hypothetical protein
MQVFYFINDTISSIRKRKCERFITFTGENNLCVLQETLQRSSISFSWTAVRAVFLIMSGVMSTVSNPVCKIMDGIEMQ